MVLRRPPVIPQGKPSLRWLVSPILLYPMRASPNRTEAPTLARLCPVISLGGQPKYHWATNEGVLVLLVGGVRRALIKVAFSQPRHLAGTAVAAQPKCLTLATTIAIAHVVRTRPKTFHRMQSTTDFPRTLSWVAVAEASSNTLQEIVRQVCVWETVVILVATASRP